MSSPPKLPVKVPYVPSTKTGPVCRWVVSEWFRRDWRDYSVVPANSEAAACEKARRYGMRPKDRLMKARHLKVTKK